MQSESSSTSLDSTKFAASAAEMRRVVVAVLGGDGGAAFHAVEMALWYVSSHYVDVVNAVWGRGPVNSPWESNHLLEKTWDFL